MAKTFDEIMDELVARVQSQLGNVDTRVGTVLREAILAPLAEQLEDAFSRIDDVSLNQSIRSPNSITEDAMDALATNFGLTRFAGSPSSGTVRFSRFLVPATAINIPAGTKVTTSQATDALSFSTIGAVTLDLSSQQDPVDDSYYVDVSVISDVPGTVGNVAADSIRFHSVASVDSVTNLSDLSGGKDEQTNEELATLITARAQGNLGTVGGYTSLVRENFSLIDMAIIGPTDEEANRAHFGGALDIVILTDQTIASEETADVTTTQFFPTFLPLVDVTEIRGIDSGDVEQVLVEGTDYTVVIDDFSENRRSYQEQSRIDISISSFVPKVGSVLTIRYRNNELVRIIQSFLLNEDYLIIGSDPLVKAGIQVDVNVTADIRVIPGFDSTTVQDAAEQAVQDLLDAKLLDDDAQSSDIVTAIGNVEGVDSIDLGTFSMAKASDPGTPLDEILANKQEYMRADTIAITVIS